MSAPHMAGAAEDARMLVGEPVDRVDGRLKVTGAATYSAEFRIPNAAHGVLVQSTVARGRIRAIDTTAAEAAPGVLGVVTHLNIPRLQPLPTQSNLLARPGEGRLPLSDDRIHHAGQHVAVVVAETLEQAEHAARLVRVTYDALVPAVEMKSAEAARRSRPERFFATPAQVKRGDAAAALEAAPVRVGATYTTPAEHHHPIEPHAVIAVWEGDRLTLYDTTQGVAGSGWITATYLGIPPENVRVVAHFIGGAFGSKGIVWGYQTLAALAARQVRRPVKLVLSRQQMVTSVGQRGETVQRVELGAGRGGALTALRHDSRAQGSEISDFFEPCGMMTKMLYATPALEVGHELVRLNIGTPTFMRAPGESPGTFAVESALDELAYELGMDPVQLRVVNHADTDPENGKPWSSKELKECYRIGAREIGWARRTPEPRSMRDGRLPVGMGVATATYPANRNTAGARARILPDGSAVVSSATQDIGTGTYTWIAQLAADTLGLPLERVRVEIGDSLLPVAPTAGGSRTVASLAPAVQRACEGARAEVVRLAIADRRSPLSGARAEEVAWGEGRLFLRREPARGESYARILERGGSSGVEVCYTTPTATPRPPAVGGGLRPRCDPYAPVPEMDADQERYSFHCFGAQFAEVRVDPDLGIVRVARIVSVHDVGTVLNAKMAESQIRGGVVYGIGMALTEESHYDPRSGLPVTRTLGDYHVPTHADVPRIDVRFVGVPDTHINSIGARGIGEIGITGVAAAIANAVYHATGVRPRDLPITPDKLL